MFYQVQQTNFEVDNLLWLVNDVLKIYVALSSKRFPIPGTVHYCVLKKGSPPLVQCIIEYRKRSGTVRCVQKKVWYSALLTEKGLVQCVIVYRKRPGTVYRKKVPHPWDSVLLCTEAGPAQCVIVYRKTVWYSASLCTEKCMVQCFIVYRMGAQRTNKCWNKHLKNDLLSQLWFHSRWHTLVADGEEAARWRPRREPITWQRVHFKDCVYVAVTIVASIGLGHWSLSQGAAAQPVPD